MPTSPTTTTTTTTPQVGLTTGQVSAITTSIATPLGVIAVWLGNNHQIPDEVSLAFVAVLMSIGSTLLHFFGPRLAATMSTTTDETGSTASVSLPGSGGQAASTTSHEEATVPPPGLGPAPASVSQTVPVSGIPIVSPRPAVATAPINPLMPSLAPLPPA